MSGVDISVIIPTHNRLWSLPQTIASCKNNKCKVEVIVIDDGSTDGTLAWLNEQENIIVIQQSNSGKCLAVNKGVAIARGTYVRFLDSDDLINANANDEQFELAGQANADIVVSGYQNFNNEGQNLKSQPWIQTDDFIAQQLGEGDGSHYSAFLFKKTFIEDIPHRPDFAFRDDRLFILEAALKGPKIAVHRGTALRHRVAHHDRLQISAGPKQEIQNTQHLDIYKRILTQLLSNENITKRRIDAAINILWPLAHWIAIYNLAEAEKLANWIYGLKPDFIPPEKGLLGLFYKHLGFLTTEQILRLRRKLLLR